MNASLDGMGSNVARLSPHCHDVSSESIAEVGRVLDRGRISLMLNQPDWPDELDALNAAAQHHALLFENEFEGVLETRLPPGQTVPLRTHGWPRARYILSCSAFVRHDGAGASVRDRRITGK